MWVTTEKRSSWPSTSGNVPTVSNGFCVATRKKGCGRSRDTPSTVTWRSSIASSSADWVRGVARLSSSTSTTCANNGPGRNSHSLPARWKTETPVSSDGRRSGVHWTRWNTPPMLRASALASRVLPTPGTSSTRRWPPESSATSARVTGSGLPRRTASTRQPDVAGEPGRGLEPEIGRDGGGGRRLHALSSAPRCPDRSGTGTFARDSRGVRRPTGGAMGRAPVERSDGSGRAATPYDGSRVTPRGRSSAG